MIKVLHIIPNLKKGGAERICLDICNELYNHKGIQVKLVLLSNDNEYEFLSKNLDIQVINDKVKYSISGKSIIKLDELKQIVNEFKPNLIHSHLYEAEIYIKELQEYTIPNFFHIHDNIIQFAKLQALQLFSKSNLVNQFERRIYLKHLKKNPTNCISISKDVQNYLKDNLPKKSIKNLFLPNAINYDRFKNSKIRNLNQIDLITIGSLVPKKGHAFLIDVVYELKKITSLKVNLIILGEGLQRASLEKKIDELDLKNNIELKGLVNYPETFLENANLYIHGAIYEPFGLVIIEAMASGLPAFSTDGRGNRGLIKNNITGYFFKKRDPKLFAKKIFELTENPKKYKEISGNSVEYAKKYDIKQYVDKLIEFYMKEIELN